MAPISLEQVSQGLKEDYTGVYRDSLDNKADPVIAAIEKGSKSIIGDKAVFNIITGRAGGISATAEDGDFPVGSGVQFDKATVATKNMFATLSFNSKLMKAALNDKRAAVNFVEENMKSLMDASKDNMRRMYHGDGTGKLATIKATSATATMTVDSLANLAIGYTVDVHAAGGAKKGRGLIIDLDYNAKKVTLDTSVSVVDTDILVMQDSYNNEITGLGKILTPDNVLYGINRATKKIFNPLVKTSAGAISDVLIQQYLRAYKERNGKIPSHIVFGTAVSDYYLSYKEATQRNVNTVMLKSGFSAIEYVTPDGVVPIVESLHQKADSIRMIDVADLELARMADFEWMNGDGGTIFRLSDTKPVYQANIECYAELICNRPSGFLEATGITG